MTGVVLGVDPSLCRTGLAAITHQGGVCTPHTWVAATEPTRTDSVAHRVRRLAQLRRQLLQVLDRITPPGLALVEAPSYGSHNAHGHENAGAWWTLVTTLVQAAIPVGTCAPATRAKWATGSGKADKAAVVAAMRELWPEAGCTRGEGRRDECDALAMATAAAQHAGWPVPTRPWHGPALEVIRWPATPAVTR